MGLLRCLLSTHNLYRDAKKLCTVGFNIEIFSKTIPLLIVFPYHVRLCVQFTIETQILPCLCISNNTIPHTLE